MKKEFAQNDVTSMRELGINLAPRWEAVLGELTTESGFEPNWDVVRQSEWWRSGKVGTVSIEGEFEGKAAVLKIQGTRPNTSEVEMINAFNDQNKSVVIRAPKIYYQHEWTDHSQYEAAIYERVFGKTVVENHPAKEGELDNYWRLYEEYRRNCLNEVWVSRPQNWSYSKQVEKWIAATENLRQNDNLTLESDWELMRKGVEIIESNLSVSDLEFMHGHFQPGDLVQTGENEVVLFSNLFWSYRIPHYDKVFSYHWWMLGMEHTPDFKTSDYEKERDRWLSKIYSLEDVKGQQERLLKLAFLERAVPALMVDRLMMGISDEVTGIITEYKRQELSDLVEEFK